MVNDPVTDHLIRWSDDGDSFYGELPLSVLESYLLD
mgnify:FL=1